jgi:branched-chain amino acid transport system substrate-binding protein
MTQIKVAAFIGIISTCTALMACAPTESVSSVGADPLGQTTINPGDPINIGIIVSTSTGSGEEGTEFLRGVQLAVDRAGPIEGRTINLTVFETDCSPEDDQAAVENAVSSVELVGIIGPVCESTCELAGAEFAEAGVPVISPACGSPELIAPDTRSEVFFKTAIDSAEEAYLAADFAYNELGSRQALIVYSDDGSSDAYTNPFEVRFTSLGGTVVSEFAVGDGRLARSIAANSSSEATIYAPISLEEAITLGQQLSAAGIEDVNVIGNHRMWSNWFIRNSGNAVDGFFATGPYLLQSTVQSSDAEYALKFNEPPPNSIYAYAVDATNMLLSSISDSAVVSNGHLIIGRQRLLLRLGQTANFDGTTGTLTCTTWGDCSSTSLAVGQISDQEWRVIFLP